MSKNIVLIMCVLVIGCSKPSDSADQTIDRVQPKRALNLDENLKKAEIACPNAKECVAAVGLVVINDQDPDGGDVRQCTGFLVDDDVVATASQCIPNEVKADPKLCAERIGIKFPGAGGEAIACGSLLSATELTASGQRALALPDVAFFSLKQKSARKPLSVARVGLDFRKPHHAFVMTGTPGKALVAKLEKRTCTLMRGTDFVPSYTRADDDIAPAFGTGCEFQASQLGAPILNSENKVVGLTYDVPKELKTVKPAALQMPEKIDSFGLITNFYCLEFPAEVDDVSKPKVDCSEPAKDERKQAGKKQYRLDYFSSAKTLLDRAYAKWLEQAPRLFRYNSTILLTFTESVWSPAPKAVGATKPDIKCVRQSEFNRIRKRKKGISSSMHLPRFSIDQIYDSQLRRRPKLSGNAGPSLPFVLMLDSAKGVLTLEMQGQKMEVPFCEASAESVPDTLAIRTK